MKHFCSSVGRARDYIHSELIYSPPNSEELAFIWLIYQVEIIVAQFERWQIHFMYSRIFRMLLLSMLKLFLVLLGSHDLWPKHNHYFGKNCLTWILPLLFLLCTCRTDLTDATNRVGALQRQLRDLQGSRQNRLTLFGSWQPDLHQRIEQAARRGRFHHAPVGPIGMESLSCSARVLHSVERNNLLLVNTYLCQKPLTQKRCLHFRSIITVLCMLAYSFKAWPSQIFRRRTHCAKCNANTFVKVLAQIEENYRRTFSYLQECILAQSFSCKKMSNQKPMVNTVHNTRRTTLC